MIAIPHARSGGGYGTPLKPETRHLNPLGEPRPAYLRTVRRLDLAAASEAELAEMWAGQRFPAEALKTVDGRTLRVVFRGLRGAGPGPDFRGAIIAAPDGLWEGDVELHRRTSDFARHGHGADAAYTGVILHLVLEHDAAEPETVLADGRRAPVVALGSALGGRGLEARRWLAAAPRWQEPCRDSQARLGTGGVAAILDRLGEMRFRAAVAVWGKRLSNGDADGAIWAGTVEAMGYGGERRAFQALARALPWPALAGRLGVPGNDEGGAMAMAAMTDAFAAARSQQRRVLRPANRPERRLRALAALARRFAPRGPAGAVLALLELPPATAAGALVEAFCVPRLIGRSRALEVLTNAVLPVACALSGEHGVCAAERVYALLPLPARYGAVRHLHEAAAGILLTARRQQGMLYLLKGYCTQGGCGRCALS